MSDSITRESTPLWRETIAVFGPCMRRIWPMLILEFLVLLIVWRWKLADGYYDIPVHHHSWGPSVFNVIATLIISYVSTVLCLREFPIIRPPVFERRAGVIFFVFNLLNFMATVPAILFVMVCLDFSLIGIGVAPALGDPKQLQFFLIAGAPAAALCTYMIIRTSIVCLLVAGRVRQPINNGWSLIDGQGLRMGAYFFWSTLLTYVLFMAEKKLGAQGGAEKPLLPENSLLFGVIRNLAWVGYFALGQAFNIAAAHVLYNDRRRADPAFILEVRHERPR